MTNIENLGRELTAFLRRLDLDPAPILESTDALLLINLSRWSAQFPALNKPTTLAMVAIITLAEHDGDAARALAADLIS